MHTQKLFPVSHASSSPAIQVSATTILTTDNSGLAEHYKATICDDSKWQDALTQDNTEFQLEGNLVFHNDHLFVPLFLHTDILHSCHNSVLTGHPGHVCTLALIEQDYSWPGLTTYIYKYICACNVCSRIKMPRHKPYGLLHPLKIPDWPWWSITMDYIVKLPSFHGYDLIWVVCDHLTQYAHFVPYNETLDAPGLAWLFLDHIFYYHGLLDSIILDQGSTFVSTFWKELTALLQIEHKALMAYHPQTDSLSKCTNQTLVAYLHAYISYQQDDWVNYLPLTKFTFNNDINLSTNMSPFFTNFRFHPSFEPCLTDTVNIPAVANLATHLEHLYGELCAELKSAQEYQACYYNQHVSESPHYQPDQLVWLLCHNIKTTCPSNKLDHHHLSPYPIKCAIPNVAYKPCLPPSLLHLHPIFHISLLEPYHNPSDFHAHASPMPFVLNTDNAPLIHSILDSHHLSQCYKYLVHWEKSSLDKDSWIPLLDIPSMYNKLLNHFHHYYPCSLHPPDSVLHCNCSVESTDATPSAPSAPQVPPATPKPKPASTSTSAASTPMPCHCPHCTTVPPATPCPPSPAPVHINPCMFYMPPLQTMLWSGHIS